jgi:hypothetical protein
MPPGSAHARPDSPLLLEAVVLDKALIDPTAAVMAPPHLPPYQLPGNGSAGENNPPQMPDICPSWP